jgi:iron(III) transport system substrate-binding protein
MRRALLAIVLAALTLAGCRGGKPAQVPEVRVHVTMDGDAAAVLVQTARARGIADVKLVPTPAEAEVFWLRDPAEVVALGDRIQVQAFPAPTDIDARLLDPRGRFLPVCARARVFIVNPRAGLPFEPRTYADLADPRAKGRVALTPLTSDDGLSTVAALALRHGMKGVMGFLEALAKNEPYLAESDAEVRDRVIRGEAAFGLVGSELAAAIAASAAGLEVVVPDQAGRGAILIPTTVSVAPGAGEHAVKLAHWIAGRDSEAVLAARVPGLMPLRDDVPVPVGVQPTPALRAMVIDWDRFVTAKETVRTALEGWPEQWLR